MERGTGAGPTLAWSLAGHGAHSWFSVHSIHSLERWYRLDINQLGLSGPEKPWNSRGHRFYGDPKQYGHGGISTGQPAVGYHVPSDHGILCVALQLPTTAPGHGGKQAQVWPDAQPASPQHPLVQCPKKKPMDSWGSWPNIRRNDDSPVP